MTDEQQAYRRILVDEVISKATETARADVRAGRRTKTGKELVELCIPTALASDCRIGDTDKLKRIYSAARWLYSTHTSDKPA